jgi:hypothetical protein
MSGRSMNRCPERGQPCPRSGVQGCRLISESWLLSMNRKGDIPVARSDFEAAEMSPFRSWPRFASNLWRFSLLMNRKGGTPAAQPSTGPRPRSAGGPPFHRLPGSRREPAARGILSSAEGKRAGERRLEQRPNSSRPSRRPSGGWRAPGASAGPRCWATSRYAG